MAGRQGALHPGRRQVRVRCPADAKPCPDLKRHPSGRAYCRWQAASRKHVRYFGVWKSPEAATGYRAFQAEWAAGLTAAKPAAGQTTVAVLVRNYLRHVDTYYVKDGRHTAEWHHQRTACRVLSVTYNGTARFYKQGQPAGVSYYGTTFGSSGGYSIGARGGYDGYALGRIGDVRYYRARVRSDAEALAEYDQSRRGHPDTLRRYSRRAVLLAGTVPPPPVTGAFVPVFGPWGVW